MPEIVYTAFNPGGRIKATDLDRLRESQRQFDTQQQTALQRLDEMRRQFDASMQDKQAGRGWQSAEAQRDRDFTLTRDDSQWGRKKEGMSLENEYALGRLDKELEGRRSLAEDDRSWRSSEAATDRGFRAEQAQTGMDHQATMAQLNAELNDLLSERDFLRKQGSPEAQARLSLIEQQIKERQSAFTRDQEQMVRQDDARSRLSPEGQDILDLYGPQGSLQVQEAERRAAAAEQARRQGAVEQALELAQSRNDVAEVARLTNELAGMTGQGGIGGADAFAVGQQIAEQWGPAIQQALQSGDSTQIAAVRQAALNQARRSLGDQADEAVDAIMRQAQVQPNYLDAAAQTFSPLYQAFTRFGGQ